LKIIVFSIQQISRVSKPAIDLYGLFQILIAPSGKQSITLTTTGNLPPATILFIGHIIKTPV